MIAIVEAEPLAELYRANFAELWSHGDVERSGHTAPRRTGWGRPRCTSSTPGHGGQLSQRNATAIGAARERVRIASPVITRPVLATLAELADRGTADVMGVVDVPQVAQVFRQWAENSEQPWKIPLLGKVLAGLPFAAKPSTLRRPDGGVHDFMHCKLTVADDVAFLGLNFLALGRAGTRRTCSRSDAGLADRLAGFVDEIRSLYSRGGKARAEQLHDLLRAVGERKDSSEVLCGDAASAEELLAHPVEQAAPVARALEDDRVVHRLAGLDQGQRLEHLVERPEAAREADDASE